jgi:hypothetical protein
MRNSSSWHIVQGMLESDKIKGSLTPSISHRFIVGLAEMSLPTDMSEQEMDNGEHVGKRGKLFAT